MASHHRSSTPKGPVFPNIISVQNSDGTISSRQSSSYLDVSLYEDRLSEELREFKDRNKQLVEHIYTLKNKLFITEKKHSNERMKSDSYIKENVEIKETLTKKNSEVKQLNTDNYDKETENRRLREKNRLQTDQIEGLKSDVRTLNDTVTALEGRLVQLQKDTGNKSVLDQLHDQNQELTTAKTEIGKLKERIDELAFKLTEKEEEKINLHSEIAKNGSEISELKMSFAFFLTSYEMEKQEEKLSRERIAAECKQTEEVTRLFQQKTLEGLSALQAKQSHNASVISPVASGAQLSQQQSCHLNGSRAINMDQSNSQTMSAANQNSVHSRLQLHPPWKTPGKVRARRPYFLHQKY